MLRQLHRLNENLLLFLSLAVAFHVFKGTNIIKKNYSNVSLKNYIGNKRPIQLNNIIQWTARQVNPPLRSKRWFMFYVVVVVDVCLCVYLVFCFALLLYWIVIVAVVAGCCGCCYFCCCFQCYVPRFVSEMDPKP